MATAESGQQTLVLIKQNSYDMVFMDVSMPDMDGYETTRRIRGDKQFTHLPIIALTAHTIAGERERCLNAGMNDFLSKPFDMEEMQRVMQSWAHKKIDGYDQQSDS